MGLTLYKLLNLSQSFFLPQQVSNICFGSDNLQAVCQYTHTTMDFIYLAVLIHLLLVPLSLVNCSPTTNCTAQPDGGYTCTVRLVEVVPGGTLVFNTPDYLTCENCFHQVEPSFSNVFDEYFRFEDGTMRIFTSRNLSREDLVIRSTAPEPVMIGVKIIRVNSLTTTTVHIVIHIIDLNDNVPTFTSGNTSLPDHINLQISEGQSVNIAILVVEAVDYDEGMNGTSSYELLGQSDPPHFNISIGYLAGRASTAELYNILPLNREVNDSFVLTIVAYEGTENPRNDTLVVTINVEDVDDSIAVFVPSEYSIFPAEDTPVNTTVTTVTAYDDDIGTNAAIQYEIQRVCGRTSESAHCMDISEASYPFALDSESGVLTLSKSLDYEQRVEYRVTVDAFNPNNKMGGTSTALVKVSVQDVNDNPPQVSELNNLSIPENNPAGSSITSFVVEDPDSPQFAKFNVSLLDMTTQMNSTVFGLRPPESRRISIIQLTALNREQINNYSLLVRAYDLNSSLFVEVPFTITVTDVNDNRPIFTSLPDPLYVAENTGSGVVVLDLNATDADSGTNAEIEYSIVGTQSLFVIQPNTGILIVQGSLDRESLDSVQLLVRAQDRGTTPLSTDILLNITIQDVNDNPAIINSTVPPQKLISEATPVGTELFDVDASDADIAPNNVIMYSLVSLNPETTPIPFHIDATGRVTVNATLDREMHESYSLRVVVSDGVNQPDMRNFTIILSDVNDNRPVFEMQEYFASFYENVTAGTSVTQVKAQDSDTAALTHLEYSFVAGHSDGHFTLESDSGILRTSRALDRESIANYTLEVTVSDGEMSSEQNAIIHVSILDVNDEIPKFVNAPYNFSIDEGNALMHNVGQVTAISIEQGINGAARYYINGNTDVPFVIDAITGQIAATAVLNRETRDHYSFTVRVEDVAPPPHYATATVTVMVRDINDNPPVFNPAIVHLTLSEKTPVGSTVHIAQATDADLSPNNVTRYNFLDSCSCNGFGINEETGRVYLSASLDHEQAPNILMIVAQDADISHFTSTLSINITVLPEPDTTITFPPSFPTAYYIPEDAPIDTPLIEFFGQDHNGNRVPNLNYFLTSTQPSQPNAFGVTVSMVTSNATISTDAPLDRESREMYELNVTITKQSDPTNRVTQILTVHLIDINDNRPNFTMSQYAFSVPEGSPMGHQIGVLRATDPDFGDNGTEVYRLKPLSTIFNISQQSDSEGYSGILYLIGSLDRETQDHFELTVVVSDKGNPPMTSEIQVNVTVEDVNDNNPSFTPNVLEVMETAEVGTIVARLQGIDPDEGSNGNVIFFHQPNSNASEKFHLSQNGDIMLTNLLDFEQSEQYIFFITVRDRGSPSRSSNGNVTIRIININDHSPEFIHTPAQLTLSLPENTATLKDLINVTAVDLDKGIDGVVMYVLEDVSDRQRFVLNPQTGALQLRVSLDYEKKTQHRVGILAYDQGIPRNRISNTTVTINVININEYPPQFDELVYRVSINEGEPPNSFIAVIRAYDADSNSIAYSISDTVNFTYSATTNSLSSKRVLDHETASFHTLVITASDGTMTGMAVVEVFVNNINDNPPMFTSNQYNVEVSEAATMGTTLLYVHATDRDSNTNKAVRYNISNGNAGGAFSIDLYSGAISVRTALDFESRPMYTLTVMANDSGTPVLYGEATVMVSVTNVNEFTPQFTEARYNFTVTEQSPMGVTVGKVTATDSDAGGNMQVTYTLQGMSEYFSVQAQTGVILVALPIDRESVTSPLSLTVIASDGQLTSMTTVQITVEDINDNRPVFPFRSYQLSMNLSQIPLSTFGSVVANDADIGTNSVTHYTISNIAPSGLPIAVNSSTGALYLTQALSSSHAFRYEFTMTAVDSLQADFSDQATVELFVVQENNHPPSFSQRRYSTSVAENTLPSTTIITVTATDPDSGANGQITYSLEQTFDRFSINNEGAINLTHFLDYEAVSHYNLTVFAVDSTPNLPRTASAVVSISVGNINDNSPDFPSSSLTLSPLLYTGVTLFQAKATDADNSPLSYVLHSYTDRFDLDTQTGVVKNKRPLEAGTNYGVIIEVSDGTNSPTTGTIVVTIANTSSTTPFFTDTPNPLQLQMTEQTSNVSVYNFTATGSSSISYYLVKVSPATNIFSLDVMSGALKTIAPLNYELHTGYELVVEVRSGTDSVHNSRFTQLVINVTNVNEFTPKFATSALQKTIQEDISVAVSVVQVEATDEDAGTFGEITYSISSNGGAFVIDSSSGTITKPAGVSLDREQVAKYTLTVTARDGGGLTATATVTITVADINDTPPQFPGNYTIGVTEPGEVGDLVLRVQATDADSSPPLQYGAGSVSSYLAGVSKGSSPNTFHVNISTGEIKLMIPLDHEMANLYVIPVTVTDGSHTITTFVHVNVEDINDNYPTFTANMFTANIRELAPIGTSLIKVTAADKDSGTNGIVRYRLIGWPEMFSIDTITGVVRVEQTFTYEQFRSGVLNPCLVGGPAFTGTVEASDGAHMANVTVVVNVVEVNNHPPVFSNDPFTIRVSETASIGHHLVDSSIMITDADCGLNGYYTTELPSYYFAPSNLFKWVNVVTNKYQLQVKSQLKQGIYRFRIQAYNEDPFPSAPEYFLAGYGHFTVEVLPANEHSPVFTRLEYTATPREDERIGSAVVQTLATDADLGMAGRVTYKVPRAMEEGFPFAVNSSTGEVYTTEVLDRETTPSYSFLIVATDSGFPARNTTASVTIIVADVNDNAPVFQASTFSGNVTENSDAGTYILTVSAVDSDLSLGGQVTYSIPLDLPFRIDSSSGRITTSGSIDFESQPVYQFQVKARDRGTPSLSNSTQVVITVIEVNEHHPQFSSDNQPVFMVSSNAVEGDIIGRIKATDEDSGKGGEVGFLLLRVTREGYIILRNGSNNTGEILLARSSALATPEPETSRRKRQDQGNGFSINVTVGAVAVDGSSPIVTTTVAVQFPPGFDPLPVSPPFVNTPGFIAIVSVVAFIGILATVMVLVVCAVMFKGVKKRKSKYPVPDAVTPHQVHRANSDPQRYTTREELEMTEVAIPSSRQRRQINSTSSPEDMEGDFSSPELCTPHSPSHHMPRNRSTSDLASTVATEALTQDTSCSYAYNKAQIEAIYAANANLLRDVSQDSVHSFNSEGGGEADGDVDIDNMIFAKYGLDTEGSITQMDDDISYEDKDRQSFTDSSGGRDEYHFTQSTNPWSRPGSLARSITEMSTPGEARSTIYHSNALYEPSQGVSGYGYSTQGSNVSLLRHHRRYGNSDQDLRLPPHQTYEDYFPDADVNHPPPFDSDIYPHSHPHSHTPVMQHQYEANMMDYRSTGTRSYQYTPDQLVLGPPPPSLPHYTQPPPPSYYHGHSETQAPQHLLRTFEPILSSSSTSLSTNASHPLPHRHPNYAHMEGYH